MKAEELRIGNLIMKDDTVFAITGITPKYVSYEHSGELTFNFRLEDVQPILITAEWLGRFGFQENRLFSSMRRPLHQPQNGLNKTWLIVSYDYLLGWLEVFERDGHPESVQTFKFRIQFVHELQNLMFALTSSELLLNESIKK